MRLHENALGRRGAGGRPKGAARRAIENERIKRRKDRARVCDEARLAQAERERELAVVRNVGDDDGARVS